MGAGLPFELEEIEGRGVAVRVWKHAPRTLGDVLVASADYGERACLVLDDERLSYADHHRLVRRFAQVLRTRYGVRKGDRVAIAMRNLPEWSVAFWAVAGIGAIVVPLNAWLTARELGFCVTDSGARVVVADAKRASLLASCREELDPRGLIVVRGEGTGHDDGVAIWDDLLAGADDDPPPPDVAIEPDYDATIFYTSGTTGVPKGALGTHRNICTNIMTVAYRGAVRQLCRGATPVWLGGPVPHPTVLVPVPFFHVTGCHSISAPALFGGTTLILMHRWDPERALELVEREKVTNFTGVPGMLLQMLESPGFADHDTSSLVGANYGGTPPPSRLLDRVTALLPQVEAENGYGLTEASSLVSYNA
ncbi:MAG: class I adenylate-forming enzyme family protein, partial [Rhodospirillales bacterium]|nr:class I adenylate-forming enzyme family protein [Rhodospirillales bacterium]